MSRIDADQVRSLYRQGYNQRQVAEMVGCSVRWVNALLNPRSREGLDRSARRWMTSGVCQDCGGQMTVPRHGELQRGKAHERCMVCHKRKRKAESLERQMDAEGNLWCGACKVYHPAEEFPPSMRHREHGNRRCTKSDSALRAAYRARRRIPCVQCGNLRYPTEEKQVGWGRRRTTRDTGLCRDCWRASRRVA